ncbi:hypothetical protein DY218_27180 [Streptomyces triticagri]|uniref:Uncharacterized protein n=2 Tax=Streptomyces triticagri TaxID=2293568 RepID=A0A372LZH2_9ACTN|nr:hypothetical protein DY218_27180 [Streptomyces triticagri]
MMGRYCRSRAYALPAHVKVISRALTGLGRDYDRLLITCPPQVGKSLSLENWVMWWLAHHPTHRVGYSTHNRDLALRAGRNVRALVREHGLAFGLGLDREAAAAHDWWLATGGGMRSVQCGGGWTGQRLDAGVLDDPLKDRRAADSRRERDIIWDWMSSTYLRRLQPGAPFCLTQTRWHEDDPPARCLELEGRVEDGGRWVVVHLPAIADPSITGPDLLGRKAGAPLTHPTIPDEDTEALAAHWEEQRRTTTPRDWGALYQGNPRPREGALITHDQLKALRLRAGEKAPAAERTAVAIDPSGGGRDTAGIIAGFLGTDSRLYVTHDRTRACSSQEWSRTACLLAYETGAGMFLIERYGGDSATLILRTAWDALQREGTIPADRPCPYLGEKTAKAGKLDRAEPIAQQMREGRIRTLGVLPEWEDEWATWQPGSDSPGRVDATAYLAYGLLKVPGAQKLVGTAAGTSLTAVAASGMGSLGRGR